MKNIAEDKTIRSRVLERKDLRDSYFEELMKSRRERELRRERDEQTQREQMQRFYRRTEYTPPEFREAVNLLTMTAVDAWIFEHPLPDPAGAATRGEMRAMISMERLLTKATKLRLRELGIH